VSDRRFTEEEVSEILKQAAEAQDSNKGQITGGSGLTLSELTEIGGEVGISPDAIRQAAMAIDNPDQATTRLLGFPVGVARTVELNRKLTDEEWDHLVVDLRETFNARGIVHHEGSLRTWRNGNLQALLEPTPEGQRLRLKTKKGNAQELMAVGGAMLGFASVMLVIAAMKGVVTEDPGFLLAIGTVGTGGIAALTAGVAGLGKWARVRAQQMEAIAARLTNTKRLPD
jgi:hypothetical protein